MPIQKDCSVSRATPQKIRRNLLLALIVVPIAGCAVPWSSDKEGGLVPSFAFRLPFSGSPPEDETSTTEESKVYRQASYRELTDEVSGLLQSEFDSSDTLAFVEENPQNDMGAVPAPIIDEMAANFDVVESQQSIDLASSLGMAGANAWTIQLARQRTVEAHADWRQARALWLPTLQFGVGWNKHDGRIQATDGNVIEASRGSLFVGGGATLGSAPVAGGSGGPLRLTADLAIADAYFAPKIASRSWAASKANIMVAQNKAVLDAGVGYINLLEASGQVADAQAAISSANQLLALTQTFEQAGAGAKADVDRAATERARLARRLADANRLQRTRSAILARRLRLDPRLTLHVVDQVIVPIELSSDITDVDSQIATAMSVRPEIQRQSQLISSLCLAVKKENIDPWLPRLAVATSAGNFGGGTGSSLDNQASRSDVDLQAVWELENLGVGVAAKRSRAGSRLAQSRTELADLRDQISADVVQAYENVLNYRTQIESSREALELAEASYQRNLQRVRADEGLPIELLQAITARASALSDRTEAISNYNRSQLQLLYATGQLAPQGCIQ